MKHKKARYRIWLSIDEMMSLTHKQSLTIQGKQFHYITNVIRLRTDDYIECITDNGTVATTRLTQCTRSHITLALTSHYQKSPPQYNVILSIGSSKHLRRSFLLEKIVELALSELWIWHGDHSQGNVIIKDAWYDIVRNSATQCGNPFIPHIRSFPSLQAMLSYAKEHNTRQIAFYENENSPTLPSEWKAYPQALVMIIGCEGGFSANEIAILDENNIPKRSLGSHILRYETAGLVACSIAMMMNDTQGIQLYTSHK